VQRGKNNLRNSNYFLKLIEVHKILKPAQTRWRFLGLWCLKEFLNNGLPYYCFLNWVLLKVVGMDQHFQTDQVLILQVHERMEKEFRGLLLTYLRYDYSYITSRELSEVNPTNLFQT
jgi:hypothetical protein